MRLASNKIIANRKNVVRNALLDILGENESTAGGEVLGILADIGAIKLSLENDDGDFLLRVRILETE